MPFGLGWIFEHLFSRFSHYSTSCPKMVGHMDWLCLPFLEFVQSNRESLTKRGITPLRDIGELRARDFAGFATAYPSPRNTSRYSNLHEWPLFPIYPRIQASWLTTIIFMYQPYCCKSKHVSASLPVLKPIAAVQAIKLELPAFPTAPSGLHTEPDETKHGSTRSLARHRPVETTEPIWFTEEILSLICRILGQYLDIWDEE
jgi:hypothetical protein